MINGQFQKTTTPPGGWRGGPLAREILREEQSAPSQKPTPQKHQRRDNEIKGEFRVTGPSDRTSPGLPDWSRGISQRRPLSLSCQCLGQALLRRPGPSTVALTDPPPPPWL
ncbi:hypothetical protein AAFF_G00220430 [Aldrovandia affinis]|uniref:Uncharacterized protein n=1 Tax=Aldrovandia affinis TaxID=143900 RepID=A0AAD7RG41_9TELE|nr:hypothetical protein AAFF_G00220430 [Aldrovandia affinis]